MSVGSVLGPVGAVVTPTANTLSMLTDVTTIETVNEVGVSVGLLLTMTAVNHPPTAVLLSTSVPAVVAAIECSAEFCSGLRMLEVGVAAYSDVGDTFVDVDVKGSCTVSPGPSVATSTAVPVMPSFGVLSCDLEMGDTTGNMLPTDSSSPTTTSVPSALGARHGAGVGITKGSNDATKVTIKIPVGSGGTASTSSTTV